MTWQSVNWRLKILLGVSVAVISGVAFVDPVAQDPLYHAFADQRRMLGIPNFLNVLSNLPFLVIGMFGWRIVAINRAASTPSTRLAWKIFFFGIALTAFGSGYFHWQPNNDSLVWDRLPMTIGFMSLVSIIIAEYFSADIAKKLLLPLLLIGGLSVAYWAWTETRLVGDLRPYAIVQFLPMVLILLTLSFYRTGSDLSCYLWFMIAFYVAAKVAEQLDEQIYAAGQIVSGHTLKHLLASLAPACLIAALTRRSKLESNS